MIEIEAVEKLVAQTRQAYEGAASMYAIRLSQRAALSVREQVPTASVLVFDKDEETVTADTVIEIVSIRDAAGEDLGELDWTTALAVCSDIRTAYDTEPGFYPVADQDTYDTETVDSQWQDKNLLVLHIDTLLGSVNDG
jgi:hypothetical protein